MAVAKKKMKVTSRVVNVKRHTTGYIIGGKQHTVKEANRLARAGRLSGVRPVGKHIQAEIDRRRLSDLPMRMMKIK